MFTSTNRRWNRLVKNVHGSQKQVLPAVCQKSATLHLRILPITSADFICKNHPHFTSFNISTSADLHVRILLLALVAAMYILASHHVCNNDTNHPATLNANLTYLNPNPRRKTNPSQLTCPMRAPRL